MYNIAKASEQDRRVLFRNTAQQTGLHEAIIEKDFWVCLTLDHLFHHSPWKAAFTFKGGTSLSKCYGLIQRFSEDIDLILDWRVLGYGLHEPWAPRSNTKQDQFNKEANERAEQFLRDILLPSLRSEFGIILGMEADLYIDPDDEQTICFRYPSIFKTESILQVIRLEIGALAAWTPSQPREIRPYSAERYPAAFRQASTVVLTAAAERTFWEKVTILHHEANRPEHLPMPSRYSRHYYDLYCIAHSESKAAAYLYSDHHLRQIFNAIDEKLANVKKRLQEHSPYSHIPFRLKDTTMDDICANTHLSYMGKMIPRNELFTKEYVIHVLETGSACFTDLEQIRATYMDKLGLDPCWTYPLGVGAHHGLVILPVWEGFLCLPFTDTDEVTYEQFDLEAAELLDTGAVETLLREVRAYTDGLCAALEDMRSALQEAAE